MQRVRRAFPAEFAAEWYPLADACEALNMSRFTVLRLKKKGKLVTRQYGNRTMVQKASVRAYLDSFTTQPR